jgi:hypothetical protein
VPRSSTWFFRSGGVCLWNFVDWLKTGCYFDSTFNYKESLMGNIKKGKKRVMITVDAEQWEKLQRDFRDQGYPWGSMSFYLNGCLNALDAHLSGDDSDEAHQLPLFHLDELRDFHIPN